MRQSAMQLQGDYWVLCQAGTKRPLDWRTGAVGNAQSPELWLSREMAEAWAVVWGARIGYVLAPGCGYWCLDVDKRDLGDELSLELLGALSGCAVELSQSGTGFHVWGRGAVPEHACKAVGERLELYHEGRYIALGQYLMGDCDWDATEQLAAVVARWFAPRVAAAPVAAGVPREDAEVLERALAQKPSAAMVLGGKLTFGQLWAGEVPDGHDASSADAALAQHLAYWCGRDSEQMLRLMWRSGLVRPKWERADYLPNTVAKACAMCERVWEPPAVAAVGDFLNGKAQGELFAGCVLVPSDVAAFTPVGGVTKPDTFRLLYGRNTFILDKSNDKTTRDSWEAFTQSQVYVAPSADGYCFRPDLAPGALTEDCGRRYVNRYRPIDVPCEPGDVSLWLGHLASMFPDEGDQAQLLAYCAAVVQHPGIKFLWAPVIQGAHGNGKSMLGECVAKAIGDPYVARPIPKKIGAQFNGWLRECIFALVDEIHIPASRAEELEGIKLLITGGEGIEIEAKGKDQYTGRICANFMFTTNHKDAIPRAKTERRFAIYYSAHQYPEDLVRDEVARSIGRVWDWLKLEGGYARVAHYLKHYKIPDALNPAVGCRVAPRTSSHDEVQEIVANAVEQIIRASIDFELYGFRLGWVCTYSLYKIMEERKLDVRHPHTSWPGVLRSMGYRRATKQRVRAGEDGHQTSLWYKGSALMEQLPDVAVRDKFTEAQRFVA